MSAKVVRPLPDQRVVGRVHDDPGAREEGDPHDAPLERGAPEEHVELRERVPVHGAAQRGPGQIVATELVGGVVRVGPDVALGADARIAARQPGSRDGGDDERDAGVDPELEQEPRRPVRPDRGQRGLGSALPPAEA
jgi:hypothetical protein